MALGFFFQKMSSKNWTVVMVAQICEYNEKNKSYTFNEQICTVCELHLCKAVLQSELSAITLILHIKKLRLSKIRHRPMMTQLVSDGDRIKTQAVWTFNSICP